MVLDFCAIFKNLYLCKYSQNLRLPNIQKVRGGNFSFQSFINLFLKQKGVGT